MMLGLEIDEPSPPLCVVSVTGEIEIASAPELDRKLDEIIESGHLDIILDLSSVTFLDSSGLAVLVKQFKHLEPAGGQLRLIVTNPHVQQVLEITKLDELFAIHESLDSALKCSQDSQDV